MTSSHDWKPWASSVYCPKGLTTYSSCFADGTCLIGIDSISTGVNSGLPSPMLIYWKEWFKYISDLVCSADTQFIPPLKSVGFLAQIHCKTLPTYNSIIATREKIHHQVNTQTKTRIMLHVISFLQESLILNQAKEY